MSANETRHSIFCLEFTCSNNCRCVDGWQTRIRKSVIKLTPLFNLILSIYSISSTRWLVSVDYNVFQGLYNYCGEINCTVTSGNCIVCVDLGKNDRCEYLDRGADELIVIGLLVVAAILRLIVTIGVLLLDWLCKIEKCCNSCNNPHAQTVIILELLADVIDLLAGSIYTAYNTSSKLEESIPGERLYGRFGAAFLSTWIQGAQTPSKLIMLMINAIKRSDDENKQNIQNMRT
ncbi:uncharacterized protein LOC144419973 [Styela clava]